MISSPLGPALTPGSLDPLLCHVEGYNGQHQKGGHRISESDFWFTMCGSHKASRFEKSNRRSSWPKGRDPLPFEKLNAWYSEPAAKFYEDHLHDQDLRAFADMCRTLQTGRKFVITKSGRMAWCPESCEKGDVVVVLAGGKVPFFFCESLR